MTSKRVFLVMCGVVALLAILSFAAVVLGNNLLAKKNSKLTELKLESEVLEQQKVSILQAQKDIEKYAELERIVKQIVPQEKDQARTVREIIQFAEDAGIRIASITFPSSSLGQAAPAAPKPAEGEAAAPAPAAPAAPPVTQVKPVDGINGVYQLEINVQSVADTATFPTMIEFLKKLESNRRTSNVTNIMITPNAGNRTLLTYNMTINVYIKP
jgi:hypothetical protein